MLRITFGYSVSNGVVIINEDQAEILRSIAENYLSGKSLQQEAERLTALMVEYAPGKYNWDKHRVRRMLINPIYTGDEHHAPIISNDTFNAIQKVMQEKNTQKNYDRKAVFSSSVVPILCGECGNPTIRRYDPRFKVSTKHTCTNPECRHVYGISDAEMWTIVGTLVAETPEQAKKNTENLLKEITRLENEIERDLQCLDIDCDALKKKLFASAALQYQTLCTSKQESMDFSPKDPCSPSIIRVIKRRVSAVLLFGSESIGLRMSDGQIVGKGAV